MPDSSIIVFVFAWALAFFIPGDNLLKPLKLTLFARLILGTILGISIWALTGYFFGWIGARWLSYFYLVGNFLIWSKLNLSFKFKLPSFKSKDVDWTIPLIIIGGSIFNLTAVWFMVTNLSEGIYFCCRGITDAIYHLALTNQIVKNFPPFEPGASDVLVKNYHFLSDLVVADLTRVFKIDIATLHFRYMSLLLALLLGSSTFILGQILKLKTLFAKWLALFLYASGDIIYLLLFLRRDGLNFDITILDDASKLLAGPPRAYSIVLFLGGVCLFSIWIKKRKILAGFWASIIFGSLIGFKVYTGIFALVGLGFLGIYFLWKQQFKMTLPLLIAFILSAALYLPTNSKAGGLKFNGFWRFENFMIHKDLKISKLEYSRLTSISEGKWVTVSLYELLFIGLYFTFLFGTVNLAWIQSRNSLKLLPSQLNIFLISGLFVTIFIGSFFLQKTGGANTVQFIIGAFIIGGIYAALAIYYWLRNIHGLILLCIAIVIILLTSARSVYEVLGNLDSISGKKGFVITKEETDGLLYLRNKTDPNAKIMLSEWMSKDQPFIYVSYFSDRPMFLASGGLLKDHGFDTSEKEKIVKNIMHSNDQQEVKQLLLDNKIDYLFLHSEVPSIVRNNPQFLKKVYENEKVNIFKVTPGLVPSILQ